MIEGNDKSEVINVEPTLVEVRGGVGEVLDVRIGGEVCQQWLTSGVVFRGVRQMPLAKSNRSLGLYEVKSGHGYDELTGEVLLVVENRGGPAELKPIHIDPYGGLVVAHEVGHVAMMNTPEGVERRVNLHSSRLMMKLWGRFVEPIEGFEELPNDVLQSRLNIQAKAVFAELAQERTYYDRMTVEDYYRSVLGGSYERALDKARFRFVDQVIELRGGGLKVAMGMSQVLYRLGIKIQTYHEALESEVAVVEERLAWDWALVKKADLESRLGVCLWDKSDAELAEFIETMVAAH